jgi:hypothetical protein
VLTAVTALMATLLTGLGADGDYNSLPWRMGLLTQTNSPC